MANVSLPALVFIGIVIAQRLGELVLARRNTSKLLARGAREIGAAHYPLIVLLHAAWLVALVASGGRSALIWPWVGAYVVLQACRVWILLSLGPRWTTRIIILDEPLVRRGPYRFLRHPNYLLVAAELIAVPMALGLPVIAAVFTLLNALVLSIRIRAENAGLASATVCRWSARQRDRGRRRSHSATR